MAKTKQKTKRQAMVHKTQHRKLRPEQHEHCVFNMPTR